MLFLPLLLYCCTTGVQSQDQLYQLNDDGYIECYEDLDCPLPIELPEENSFMQFTCTGIVTFTPTALDKRLYNSTGEYTVCEETVRSNCCKESQKLTKECKGKCKEVFGGQKPLQALAGVSGVGNVFPRECPGCPFSCPKTTPCRIPSRDKSSVRCCKLVGIGRKARVQVCPVRCYT